MEEDINVHLGWKVRERERTKALGDSIKQLCNSWSKVIPYAVYAND